MPSLMTLAFAVVALVGLAMVVVGSSFVVGFLRRSRRDGSRPPTLRRADVGPVWTQRAVLGALLVTLGFFLAVLGSLLTFARSVG